MIVIVTIRTRVLSKYLFLTEVYLPFESNHMNMWRKKIEGYFCLFNYHCQLWLERGKGIIYWQHWFKTNPN